MYLEYEIMQIYQNTNSWSIQVKNISVLTVRFFHLFSRVNIFQNKKLGEKGI